MPALLQIPISVTSAHFLFKCVSIDINIKHVSVGLVQTATPSMNIPMYVQYDSIEHLYSGRGLRVFQKWFIVI